VSNLSTTGGPFLRLLVRRVKSPLRRGRKTSVPYGKYLIEVPLASDYPRRIKSEIA
jgi:hypothetical protein